MPKKRILTGDTPTGKLHLGHYVGTLENRVKLQHEYETFVLEANIHAFAYFPYNIKDQDLVRQNTLDATMDNLAVGLDPEIATIFVESDIPTISELASCFMSLVSYNRAMRNPTIKDEIRVKGLGESLSLGFLNYPIFQAADILCVKGEIIPVGKDQLPHIEQSREIARDFNKHFGETFPIPEPLIGKVGRLIGTDGKEKMSKSLGNAILLSEPTKSLKEKVMGMYTDPNRRHATDPGTVEGNPVFIYHDTFNPNKEEVKDLKDRYRQGKVGDVEVKEKLFIALENFIAPIRERRAQFEKDPDLVMDILRTGAQRVNEIADQVWEEVRSKINQKY